MTTSLPSASVRKGTSTSSMSIPIRRPLVSVRRASTDMAERALPRRGRLWAWTTQEFPPPAPYAGPSGDAFVPFGVGYVELGNEVRVETRLTETTGLRIGMEMELVLVPFRTDEHGNEVVTFAFRPVTSS